jgi:hypothetical protein
MSSLGWRILGPFSVGPPLKLRRWTNTPKPVNGGRKRTMDETRLISVLFDLVTEAIQAADDLDSMYGDDTSKGLKKAIHNAQSVLNEAN